LALKIDIRHDQAAVRSLLYGRLQRVKQHTDSAQLTGVAHIKAMFVTKKPLNEHIAESSGFQD
jgi:hypothetical protein